MNLQTPLKDAGKIYAMFASRLQKLGITTINDFLFHIPFRYVDYSLHADISSVQEGEVVTIEGLVKEIKNTYIKRFNTLQKAKVADESGVIDVTWFNQPFLTKYIQAGDKISLSGKITSFQNKLLLESPEYEVLFQANNPIHTGRLVPIYPETKGISSKWLRRQIYTLLQQQRQNIFEYLPDSIIKKNAFMGLIDAIEQIHFPDTIEYARNARLRLSFDELFLLQLQALSRRESWTHLLTSNRLTITQFKSKIQQFWKQLPFELTNAQKRAVQNIFGDLASNKPMNRLLEGDVGSGKTVVATIAMYVAHLNGFQSVLMAPTEILAIQHYQTISNLLSPVGVRVGLATGGRKNYVSHSANSGQVSSKHKEEKKEKIQNTDILVGTHAILSSKINFEKLGLAVIDEQQRFGVEQRSLIRKKGKNPHLLTMTATPIPRTIALTMYGDLDLSYLDEMPKGRKIVKTWFVPPQKREAAYEWIQKQIKETKSQAFIICPFIEESESMKTVKAATKEFERLQKEVFPLLKLGLLHGKLKSKEKEAVLLDFKNKKFDILVATPVVEVGIDIPNATIIMIEASERFGLAQLHQLRGRVGRGDKQSFCLLFTESKNLLTIKRLKAMEKMHIGAELAELDLQLRGHGDLFGTQQHGITKLKVANFSDRALIELARKEAEAIFPRLSNYQLLLEKLKTKSSQDVSPD